MTAASGEARMERGGHSWRSIVLCAVLFFCDTTKGQQPTDTLELRPFEVVATRLSHYAAGTKVQCVDSAALQRLRFADLGAVLASETPVFVKSYGLGSLATTSFRGGSANHTAILWNGFNIGSPMNGQVDLSLIPMAAAGSVRVQYGGTSALWGSGALGGAIHLNNEPHFGRGLAIDGGAGFGSYGDLRQQARVEWSGKRSISAIALFNAEAQNGFHYSVREATRTVQREQTNARFRQHGLIAEQHIRINERQRLNARLWYQHTAREIPPTRVQPESSAHQDDGALRATAEWSRTAEKVNMAARGAYFDERLDWFEVAGTPAVPSRSRTWISEAEARIRLTARHSMQLGLNNTHATATSDGYPQGTTQNRTALFTAYRYQSRNGRTIGSLSAREELMDGALMPLTASAGMEHDARSWLKLKAQGARVYRVPTFNELYWRPGGDPNLLPENGFTGDAGVVMRTERGAFTARTEVTAFSRSITNWIIWLPGPGYWSPRNILHVWSRGVETDSEIAWRQGRSTLKMGVITNHVVSTNQKPTSVNDASVDKQLIYVPMYSGQGRIAVERGRFALRFSAAYTGYRYTSTDNREFLAPYWICNAYASHRLFAKHTWSATVFVNANNLFAADYEIMLNRPMPLRNYQAGISFHFERPTRKALP